MIYFLSFTKSMSSRKTIVGTNTSLNGDTMSCTIDSTNNPTSNVVNNVNVMVRGTDTENNTTTVETQTTKLDNPYENMVKYPSTDDKSSDIEILRFLMQTFQGIIVNDPACVTNIIDQSGLVVLGTNSLIRLIAMVCGVVEDNVKIEIEDNYEANCCGFTKKYLPLKQVRKIKVMKDSDVYNDFQLTYNDYYNKIIDTYKVSLENVYEKII